MHFGITSEIRDFFTPYFLSKKIEKKLKTINKYFQTVQFSS